MTGLRVNETYHKGVDLWSWTGASEPLDVRAYTWRASHRAVGAAAECARAALVFYAGPKRSLVVRCVRTAEQFSTQQWVDPDDAHVRRVSMIVPHLTKTMRRAKRRATVYAVVAAEYAIKALVSQVINSGWRLECVEYAITAALTAGVSSTMAALIHARWVVRDLADGARVHHSPRRAAIAAVIAGEHQVAKDIIDGRFTAKDIVNGKPHWAFPGRNPYE